MSESKRDTNIPTIRIPFGNELPPKVPYSDTDSVGVGDTETKTANLPVQVNNRKLVPVGSKDNKITAPFFDRIGSEPTEDTVPTSVTPNSNDPGTMVATKEYVDSASIVFQWTSGHSYVVIYGNGWCNFGGWVNNTRITEAPGRFYYNGIYWGTGVAKAIRPYVPVSAVYGVQVSDNGGAIATVGQRNDRNKHQSYKIGTFSINTTSSSELLVTAVMVYFNANQFTLSTHYRGYSLSCNAIVHPSFLSWLKSSRTNVDALREYLNSTARVATSSNYICIPATATNRAGTTTRANTSDATSNDAEMHDDRCGFILDSTSEGGGDSGDIPSDPGDDIIISSSGKILVVTPGGSYANTNITGVGSCTRSGSGPYTFTITPFKSGYLSIDFCCEKIDGAVDLTLSVDGTILAYSHGFPSNRSGITTCIPVKSNMKVVISGSPVATPRHANIYII